VKRSSIADYLESQKSNLLARWRRIAETHPDTPTQNLSDQELEDHLPEITDQIIKALRGAYTNNAIEKDGRIHGHRRRNDGYTVGDVAWELSLYRQLIVELIEAALESEPKSIDDDGARKYAIQLMDRCLRNSIEQFVLEADEAREAAQSQTQELLEQRERFLLTLSHELRNQVSPIMLAVRLLEESRFTDPRQQRAVRIIERQARHQSALINDLLDIDRYRFGRLLLRRDLIDLREPLEHALETCLPEAEVKSLNVQITIPSEKMAALADRDRTVQVVTNLVNNAIRFTPAGGNVGISLGREGDKLVLRVRDSGVGITPQALPHIFDLFFQAGKAQAQGMGLGVGLALVKSLVEMHGGHVEARSEGDSKGSEFIVQLPAAEVADRAEPERQVKEPVLLVDDSPDQLQILSDVLSDLGHHIVQASNGRDALRLAAELKPIACIADIGLPDFDGYELARRLRASPAGRDLLLIATSGWGTEEDKKRALDAGFDHHFTKPVDVDGIHALLVKRSTPSS
jgi:signal transduction histidine kinase/ActR/RegA family two-component response regulator